MRIGFHLTPFWSPTDRRPTDIIDEAIHVVRAAAGFGFAWVSIGHHWMSHPTVWPQPVPMLARLAPEAGPMRLKTSMLLLPLLNAVDVAENVATLDHITHGRLDVGVAIGYRERELEAAGLGRKDRVPKLEESLALMKRLETITRAHALGLDGIGLTIYSLSREAAARIEYLQMIAEQIVRPAAALR